jgi:putative ABC transport system permease protein
MLKNYFKTAWRNLRKEKGFSAINIFGLAVGLATCLLITLFVIDELSYDKFNEHADRIYRVDCDLHINGSALNGTFSPPPMGPSLLKDYPQIENIVRMQARQVMYVKKGDETLVEHSTVLADSSFFEVFTFPLIAGDPHTALREPHTMVISEDMAKKYFGSDEAVGKNLLIDNKTNFKITGVMRNMPAQSHFHFDFIRAMSEDEDSRSIYWLNNNPTTYILAKPGVTPARINADLALTVTKYIGPQLQTAVHSTLEDMAKHGDYFRYTVTPLTNIHLYSNIKGEFEANGNIRYVYIFTIVGILILLVACVNFMNLSTARSAGRAKEIGVRKVLGSLRGNLVYQFLVESVLTSFIALILSLLFVWVALPYLNHLAAKKMTMWPILEKNGIPLLVLGSVVVGMIAGSYPALYLSGFRPIQVLKGKLSTGFRNGWLRNSLVVFQFTTAIVLIIGTLVIYSQLNYIRNRELGYNRDQVLILKNTYPLNEHAKEFRDEALKIPGIMNGTITGALPNSGNNSSSAYFKDATTKVADATILGRWVVDANYIPTLGMQILQGRNFSPLMLTDTSGIIINETAVRFLGLKDPINQTLYTFVTNDQKVGAFRIIGVVKDFNAGSMHNKIEPLVFHLGIDRADVSFRIHTANIPALIDKVKEQYNAVPGMAGQPFTYTFMDDDFNKLYASDDQTGRIFITFACLAICIACLGLFGLVTYAAEQRTREIGIRKVLGASLGNVIGLLSKDFLKLVMVSALIAFPLAWWAMHKWLQDFAYRTNIGWWVFFTAGLSALAITLVTVSFRAIRAALANPVNSLRSE